MYIGTKGGYKIYHYKPGDTIRVKGHYKKETKTSPIGRKYIVVKKKVK